MPEIPDPTADERELLLRWLGYFREAVIAKLDGLDEDAARFRPDGKLIGLIGIVNHLTHVEWRWIDGAMRGAKVSRSEAEFTPGPELTVPEAIAAYRRRGEATDEAVREMTIDEPCRQGKGRDLRWVLLHLINESARHCGHADATREMLDGTTGE